jgi:membrane-associated protease RseP (regulator of RpoE activity)
VPFELLSSKHIAVKVKINGKGPYRFIFDTGAPFMIVNFQTAKDSGMLAKNARPPWFAFFNSMGPVAAKTLEVGSAKLENKTLAVMDHPTVGVISEVVGPIAGLIGYPFFAAFRTTIDYQAKRLTLIPNGFDAPDSRDVFESLIVAMTEEPSAAPKVLAPAAQWGLVLHKDAHDDKPGVLVREVRPGSAAAAAGLHKGDRLLTLDGRWTDSLADAYRAAGYLKPGVAVPATLRRDGREQTITITPRSGL